MTRLEPLLLSSRLFDCVFVMDLRNVQVEVFVPIIVDVITGPRVRVMVISIVYVLDGVRNGVGVRTAVMVEVYVFSMVIIAVLLADRCSLDSVSDSDVEFENVFVAPSTERVSLMLTLEDVDSVGESCPPLQLPVRVEALLLLVADKEFSSVMEIDSFLVCVAVNENV